MIIDFSQIISLLTAFTSGGISGSNLRDV